MALVHIEVVGKVGLVPGVEPNLAGDIGLHDEAAQFMAAIVAANFQLKNGVK